MSSAVSVLISGYDSPEGPAFDRDGNLYVAASYRARRGIIRIDPGGRAASLFVAGMNVVGLAFTARGEMLVATGEEVYALPLGVRGTLV